MDLNLLEKANNNKLAHQARLSLVGAIVLQFWLSRSDSGIVRVGEHPRFPCVRPYLWNLPEAKRRGS